MIDTQEKAIVLIVDDIPANVQTLAHLLKDDYDVRVATSGARALELCSQKPFPDLVLLDVEMPELSGYDVLRLLKENSETQRIPIIFVSGRDSAEEEEYGLSLGAVDYIVKPIRPTIVKARVKTHITLKRQQDMLVKMATHDQLTGLNNRHFLVDSLSRKFSSAKRHHELFSVILLDIDHFKNINDTFGHLVGDLILKAVGGVLLNNARKEDVAARFGGEEFMLVLDPCSLEDARIKAEKLRSEIEELNPEGVHVTASFGVAQFEPHMSSFQELMKYSDTALYQAKDGGRNRVEVHVNV